MSTETQTEVDTHKSSLRENLIYGTLLGFVGLSATGLGFAGTLADTKKSDNQYQRHHKYNIALNAEASRLACRALAIGSVYALCGVSLIAYGIWSITGASNFLEFRAFFAHTIPSIPTEPLIKTDIYDWDVFKKTMKNGLRIFRDQKELYEEKVKIMDELRVASSGTLTERELHEAAKTVAWKKIVEDSDD